MRAIVILCLASYTLAQEPATPLDRLTADTRARLASNQQAVALTLSRPILFTTAEVTFYQGKAEAYAEVLALLLAEVTPPLPPPKVWSSADDDDLARIPPAFGAGYEVGVLHWLPSPSVGVAYYEVQHNGVGTPPTYRTAGLTTEFPFHVPTMINPWTENWRVRAVSTSGLRSPWAQSDSVPERTRKRGFYPMDRMRRVW